MLKSLIEKGGILINPEFTARDEMFQWIARDAENKGLVSSADVFYQGLISREEQMSTEIEKGVAIPHAKLDEIKEIFIYLTISKKGISFGGLGSKVKISFCIGAPHNAQHYLDVMASIARLLQKNETREALKSNLDEQSLLNLIDDLCKVSEGEKPGKKNMHALLLILNDSSHMETAMNLSIELGIKGAQVFDTTNVAAKIALNFPFLSLMKSKNDRISSKTLFGVIESETIATRLVTHMKKEGIDVRAPGAGILYSFPLNAVYGGIDEDYA